MESFPIRKKQCMLKILHLAEQLKCTLRHGWTSTGRQESVAEHSWRLAFMVLLFQSELDESVDLLKSLKMAIIHDFAETVTGDIPFFEALEGTPQKEKKHAAEKRAMELINTTFKLFGGGLIYEIWNEYQSGKTKEAQFVHALDKIEAQIQQNEADISTWNDFEKQSIFTYLDKFCDYDTSMKLLKDLVRDESIDKLQSESKSLVKN